MRRRGVYLLAVLAVILGCGGSRPTGRACVDHHGFYAVSDVEAFCRDGTIQALP